MAFYWASLALRFVPFLCGLGQLVGQIIGALVLRRGGGQRLFTLGLRIRQFLIDLRQVFFRLGQVFFCFFPLALRLDFGIALGVRSVTRVEILSRTWRMFNVPAASAATMAKIRLIRINMALIAIFG